MGNNEVIRLQIPSALEHVRLARLAVDSFGEHLHLPNDTRDAVALAVGEACSNAVLYAKGGGKRSPVVITCRVKTEALEIDIANSGSGFRPAAKAEMPAPEALAEHGRGRALMETLMDSVEYLSVGGNTLVRLRKRLPGGIGGVH